MPTRTLLPNLLLGVIGLLAVGWLVLWRLDVRQASRRGPRWRQRIVTAGLLLLAVLGFTPPASAGGKRPVKAGASSSPEWKRITHIRAEAEAVASGKRGPYPFDRAGKQRLLGDLKAATTLVDDLAKAGKISEGAAGLLKLDIETLGRNVARKRPTEMRNATCYRPMMATPRRNSFYRLRSRLPLLEKLARSRKIQAAVLHKALAAIEADLKVVGDGKLIRGLRGEAPAQAPKVVKRTRSALAKVKKILKRTR